MSLDIDKHLSTIRGGGCVPERQMRAVIAEVNKLLIEESNVVPVAAPVTLCGDIHGQLYDLFELFKTGGEPPGTSYVFIGDYVDRGCNSVEVFEYLCCLKMKYPHHITLLRGNHESRKITLTYGFSEEIVRKYGNANL